MQKNKPDLHVLESLVANAELEFRSDSTSEAVFLGYAKVKVVSAVISGDYKLALSQLFKLQSKKNQTSAIAWAHKFLAIIYLRFNDFSAYDNLYSSVKLEFGKNLELQEQWYATQRSYYFARYIEDNSNTNYLDSIKKYNELNLEISTADTLALGLCVLERIRMYIDPSGFAENVAKIKELMKARPELPFKLGLESALAAYYNRQGIADSALFYYSKYFEGIQPQLADKNLVNPRYVNTLKEYLLLLKTAKNPDKNRIIKVQQIIMDLNDAFYQAYKSFKSGVLDIKLNEELNLKKDVSLHQAELAQTKRSGFIALLVLALVLMVAIVVIALLYNRLQNIKKTRLELLNEDFKNDVSESLKNITESKEDRFTKAILEVNPKLTSLDVKVLLFVKQGKTSKEMADELGISLKGAESAKYRARKKIDINPGQSLFEYLNRL